MGLPMERWLKQATILDPPPKRVVNSDVLDLMRYQQQFWRGQMRQLRADSRDNGVPIALEGLYAGMPVPPPTIDIATSTTAGEQELVGAGGTTKYLPISNPMGGETFRYAIQASITTGATASPTSTITPRFGTSTGGTALGASAAMTLTISVTSSLHCTIGDLTFRSTGTSGSVVFIAHWFGKQATAGAGSIDLNHIYGAAAATTVDTTTAQNATSGLWLGHTGSNTTIAPTVRQVHWMSWN